MRNTKSFSLVIATFVLLFFIACDLSRESSPPTINLFTASATSIDTNGNLTLKWQVKGAEKVSIDNGIGTVPAEGSKNLTLSHAGNYAFTLTAVNGETQNTAVVTVICKLADPGASRIIDHNCLDLSRIPPDFIALIKQRLLVQYAPSGPHGDQIILGLQLLFNENPLFAYSANQCKFVGDPTILRMIIGNPTGNAVATAAGEMQQLDENRSRPEYQPLSNDNPGEKRIALGRPWRSRWLCEYYVPSSDYWASDDGFYWILSVNKWKNSHPNVSIWFWENDIENASHLYIMHYLKTMKRLYDEAGDDSTFVLTTGPADTPNEQRWERNKEIRNYCIRYNLWLLDIEDIETWYNGQQYVENGIPTRDPHYADDGFGGMTNAENCRNKAIAYWWLLARIAGWDGE